MMENRLETTIYVLYRVKKGVNAVAILILGGATLESALGQEQTKYIGDSSCGLLRIVRKNSTWMQFPTGC